MRVGNWKSVKWEDNFIKEKNSVISICAFIVSIKRYCNLSLFFIIVTFHIILAIKMFDYL